MLARVRGESPYLIDVMKILIALCLCLLSQISFAQRDTSFEKRSAQPIIVIALRTPADRSLLPYSTTIAEGRSDITGLSLSDGVLTIPGLQINDRYNFAVGDRITNRGMGARTQFGVRGIRVLLDDVPLTLADGQSTLEMVDPQEIASIEMLRGPGSSLYGNASGGVLLLRSRSLPAEPVRAFAGTTTGASGLQKLGSNLSGTYGDVKIGGAYSNLRYDGFRAHSLAKVERETGRVTARLSSNDALSVSGGYVKFFALNPGSLTASEFANDPTQAAASSVKMNAYKDGYQEQLGATWKHVAEDGYRQLTLFGIGRNLFNPIVGKVIDLDRKAGGATVLWSERSSILDQPFEWSAGGDLNLQFDDRQNHRNNNGVEAELTLDQKEEVTAEGVFLQLSTALWKSVRAMGSMRYDRTHFAVTDHFINEKDPDDSGDRTMDAISPSIGLLYKLDTALSLFANLSTSFETPTTTELANRPDGAGGFNPDLKPSHTIGYEAGFRGSLTDLLTYDLALYYARVRDEMISFQVPDAQGRDFYRNAGSSVHRGGEFSIVLEPGDVLTARGSISVTDAYFDSYETTGKNFSGLKIPGIAPIRFAEELTYHAPWGLYLDGVAEEVGKTFVNDTNSAFANAYSVIGLRVGHEGISFGSKWKTTLAIAAGVNNIFDVKYASSVTVNAAAGRYYEPAPGRNFYLNVKLDFGQYSLEP
jgi:iron complex outermembrane receptor protein